MTVAPGNSYTIGRNVRVVLIWNGSQINLKDVVGFDSQQQVKPQRAEPLNSVPIEFNTPTGWRGRFMVDRGNAVLDNLIAANEAAFWTSGVVGTGTIYQYITETNGAQTSFEFSGVAIALTEAGNYAGDGIVKQTLSFVASQRVKIS